jgi:hypothetical protein
VGAWLCLHFLFADLRNSIVFFLITLYLYTNTLFPKETILETHRKKGNLTENHTTSMASEIYAKQAINEENSHLFMNNIL